MESFAELASSNGLLNKTIRRENFAIDSIMPAGGSISGHTFQITTDTNISSITSLNEVEFIADSNDTVESLVSVFINPAVAETLQTKSNPTGQPRPLIFIVYLVDNPIFQDVNDSQIGSLVLSLIVDAQMPNLSFSNLNSSIEFRFDPVQVPVHTCSGSIIYCTNCINDLTGHTLINVETLLAGYVMVRGG